MQVGHGNGFWKMEESYHNTIQASPRMTAVPTKKQALARSGLRGQLLEATGTDPASALIFFPSDSVSQRSRTIRSTDCPTFAA